MSKCRIIIAGGRDFTDYEKLKTAATGVINDLTRWYDNIQIEIVSGGASGADKLGERFAEEFGYSLAKFPADWDKYGKGAGIIRNKQMAKYAVSDKCIGMLIAFWDGKSRGTKNMIEIAINLDIGYYVINY